jgi:long-chain fatty acid transport protein
MGKLTENQWWKKQVSNRFLDLFVIMFHKILKISEKFFQLNICFTFAVEKSKLINMKRTFLVSLMIGAMALTSFAGGLLTNTNQSAQFVRMLSRNASTQIDAVYFNPAGLIMLEDGFHFSLNNQSIFQEKTVNSKFPLLNNGEYIGDVKAPVFPSGFAVYKMDNLAFSLGFGPVGGGGSATFERGLPSFEIPLTKVVPGLAGLNALGYNVTEYDAKLYFDGSSIFWGIQGGATYKMSDMLSVYGGVRYMPSTNTYTGSIKSVKVKVNGAFVNVPEFLPQVGNSLKATATTLSNTATGLQPLIAGGAGTLTMAQLQAGNVIDAATVNQLTGGLVALGVPQSQIAVMTMSQIQGTYSAGATSLNNQGNTLIATGAQLQDKNVDTKQTGAGITPIVGLNFSPSDNLNIALKYEHKTKLELTNSTEVDDLGLFPDGQKTRSDIPALLAVGIGYQPSDFLEAQLSYNMYFDKGVDWGKNVREIVYNRDVKREIDKNMWELALGLQFNLSKNFAISLGGMTTNPGIADSYQSDFSYSNPSYSLAAGFQWKITDQLAFDAGFMNVFYKDAEVTYTDPDLTVNSGKYNEVFGKSLMGIGFGLSYSIFR